LRHCASLVFQKAVSRLLIDLPHAPRGVFAEKPGRFMSIRVVKQHPEATGESQSGVAFTQEITLAKAEQQRRCTK